MGTPGALVFLDDRPPPEALGFERVWERDAFASGDGLDGFQARQPPRGGALGWVENLGTAERGPDATLQIGRKLGPVARTEQKPWVNPLFAPKSRTWMKPGAHGTPKR